MNVENPEYLLVIFEGFNTKKNNSFTELIGKKTSILWINERKRLYLGENGREVCFLRIQDLIQGILEELNLNNYRLIISGDDVGSNMALLIAALLEAKYIIMNNPVENIGEFVNNLEKDDGETIFNKVFGDTKLNKEHVLNTLFNNKINSIKYPQNIYINNKKVEASSSKDIFSQNYNDDF